MLHTFDHWRATNPDDEHLGPEPSDEDELPEPTVEEVWDGGRGEYITEVTFASGKQFTIVQARAGAFVGDYEIHGDNFFRDGFLDPEAAIDWLCDIERRDW